MVPIASATGARTTADHGGAPAMRILFLGPPGAGKGTQAQRLIERLRVPHLSSGEMLRQARAQGSDLGRQAGAYLDAGQLVPDALVLGLLAERLTQADCVTGCLLDGFPRTVAQAEALDELLASRGTPLDLVLELRVPEAEVRRRLENRRREDDTAEVIARRVVVYRQQTEPLVAHYARRGILEAVDGTGSPDEVFHRIWTAVERRRHA
jgi:adenylate kinase